MQELQLHVEVALQQALEAAAMACLVLCHLVDGIVDRIQIQGLCLLGQVHLAGACAALSLSTHYLIPFQVKAESISGVEKTLARAKVIQENVNNSLEFLGLLMSMVKMQGIQRKNFEWVIEQTQNLLLKKYEPKTGKFEGVCCIYDRSEYTAAQQFCRPVFFSENGKPRREALELARVWVSIFKQLGLTPKKPIQIRKSEDSDKLAAVDAQPVGEPE